MYFITGLTNIMTEETRIDSEESKKHSTRCFGYYKEKENAISAVKSNMLDMWETCYNYIVIEEIGEGVHPLSSIVGWFKYNKEKNEYEPIKIDRTGFCNYSIG